MARPRLVALAAAALCGCSHPTAASDAPIAPLSATASDDVVATVDGRPIYAHDVAAQARARGVDARAALNDLVDAEALAGEAARRGLDRDLHVRDETKGALVRRYLGTTFERDVTPADVPAITVRRAYNLNKGRFDHSVLADVWHILVEVSKAAPPAQRASARARAEALAKAAKGVGSLEAFKKLASDGKLYNERFSTAKDGIAEASFSVPLFAQVHEPGDTTGVLETSFGFHVAYLIRWIPPEHVSPTEAEPLLREGLFPDLQKKVFAHVVDDAMSRHRVELHPDRLPRAAE